MLYYKLLEHKPINCRTSFCLLQTKLQVKDEISISREQQNAPHQPKMQSNIIDAGHESLKATIIYIYTNMLQPT